MAAESPLEADPRSIRLAHVGTESAIKSVGQLCFLVASLSVLGMAEFVLVAVGILPVEDAIKKEVGSGLIVAMAWVLVAFLFANAAAQAALGYGLTRLQAWARWTVVVLTVISLVSGLGMGVGICLAYPAWGLIGLLVGVAIHAAILFPLLTPGAGLVFSREYKDVIRATPEIRSRMHWLLKLCLGLIFAGVVGLVGYLAAIYFRFID